MQEEVKAKIAARNSSSNGSDANARPVGSPVMPAGRKSSFAATDVVLPVLPVDEVADEADAEAIADMLEKKER